MQIKKESQDEKLEILVFFLILSGIAFLIMACIFILGYFSFFYVLDDYFPDNLFHLLGVLFAILPSSLYFTSAKLIKHKKKWSWIFSVTLVSVVVLALIYLQLVVTGFSIEAALIIFLQCVCMKYLMGVRRSSFPTRVDA